MDINAIDESIKRGTKSVFWRIILFGVSHILLTVLSLGLFAGFLLGCVFLIYLPFYLFPDDNTRADAGEVAGFIVYVSMMILVCAPFIWCGFQLVRHFILSLFLSPISKDKNRLEVTRDDCPELFALIVDIAEKTGNKTPELVYLSPEVNASVMYEHSGKFHISKNLVIGLGLLQGMNRDELKSVIAHEFGHFTQDTKNVSYLSYRLSLIIKRMMELAQAYNRRTQVARSKAKNKNNVNSWYLANWPISLITRKFADLYKDIAKKNSSLSRLMEYEADAVACRIVGARPFISSLHKLPVFQEWYDEYENVINGLLSENKSLASYWSGYDYVFKKVSDDAQLHLTCRDIQTAEMVDNARYPSEVMVVDGYDTHPSVKSRIENILKINQTENPIDTTDARTLLPTEIMDLVGRLRQQVLAENLQESLAWSGVKEIGLDDFKAWADKEMKKTYVPHFLAPYTLRSVNSFSIPLPEEELQDPVESPFTAENREMLLEFNRCMADYQTLLQFSQEEPDKRHVMYKGKEYDCETALEEKKHTSNPLRNACKDWIPAFTNTCGIGLKTKPSLTMSTGPCFTDIITCVNSAA